MPKVGDVKSTGRRDVYWPKDDPAPGLKKNETLKGIHHCTKGSQRRAWLNLPHNRVIHSLWYAKHFTRISPASKGWRKWVRILQMRVTIYLFKRKHSIPSFIDVKGGTIHEEFYYNQFDINSLKAELEKEHEK